MVRIISMCISIALRIGSEIYVIGTELLFVLVSHQLSILSESGKAEMPSSEFIISAISSFCSRLHALPVSEFDAAPTMAAMAFCRFEIRKMFFRRVHAQNTRLPQTQKVKMPRRFVTGINKTGKIISNTVLNYSKNFWCWVDVELSLVMSWDPVNCSVK
jgi:hypothetical protein